jgi:hypothetical protein
MGGYAQAVQQRQSFDNLQRGFLASQYDNIINAPLPDANADPKAYQDAVDRKAKALEARQKVYSPDHHASLAEHLHGLITGKLSNGQTPGQVAPVSSQAPLPPGTKNELGDTLPATQGAAPEQPAHPFAHNPVYQGLIDRLKAFRSPEPPKAVIDFQSIAQGQAAGENTARQLALDAENRKQKNALEVEAAKAKDAQALAEDKKRAQLKPYTLPDGSQTWLDASKPESIPEGAKPLITAGQPRTSTAALATYIRAKYGENPTWQQIAEGTQEHQRLMAGVTVGQHQTVQFDSDGVPHVITLQSSSGKQFGPPVSSSAPKVSDGMAGPNARLNAKKPQSKQIPTNQLDFRKATPAGNDAKKQSDAAERSYLDVQEASKDPTPVGDQGVILSWLRGRVNRVTASEIAAVNNLGGAQMKLEGNLVRIVSGKMTDQQRKWFLDSAKHNYENAKKVEKERTGPVSSQAPQAPSSLEDRLNRALQ